MANSRLKELEDKIVNSYTEGITIEGAEKLAGEFLHAQLQVSEQLRAADLDSRMRRSGVKSIRSAVRTEEIKKHEKKPTEGALEDVVNLNPDVQREQDELDKAEVERDYLERYYDVFLNAHIYFRGIAKSGQ